MTAVTKFWTAIQRGIVLGSVIASCVAGQSATAAVIRHWALDETSLPEDVSGAPGEVVDSTGNSSDGRLFGYAPGADLTGVIGVAGPAGLGTAYNFVEASGISGVFTNSTDAIPATGDFTLVMQVRTTNTQSAQGHLFSNNNGGAGRANLYILNGELGWFADGGAFDTNGDSVSDGNGIAAPAASVASLFDGSWHEVVLGRAGNQFDIALDGTVVASGTSTTSVSIGQTQSWMIGRGRSFGGDYDGEVADVKVNVIPEPASASLLTVAIAGCAVARRRRFLRPECL